MRTRGCRVKPIGEILRFVGHQSFAEFHDAHRVRWYAVIGKYEFSDPEIAAADNSPDRKTLLVWLDESALLNVVPTADPLARLRIIKHSILAVDFVFVNALRGGHLDSADEVQDDNPEKDAEAIAWCSFRDIATSVTSAASTPRCRPATSGGACRLRKRSRW